MAQRPVYLFVYGRSSRSRGHFAIFIPNALDVNQPPSVNETCTGTVIHVVGSPLMGFYHEFKRNYNTYGSKSFSAAVLLGYVQESLHVDPSTNVVSKDIVPLGALDAAALQVPGPEKSDVRAPVDGVCVLLFILY